jgi:hypothetical protein
MHESREINRVRRCRAAMRASVCTYVCGLGLLEVSEWNFRGGMAVLGLEVSSVFR